MSDQPVKIGFSLGGPKVRKVLRTLDNDDNNRDYIASVEGSNIQRYELLSHRQLRTVSLVSLRRQ